MTRNQQATPASDEGFVVVRIPRVESASLKSVAVDPVTMGQIGGAALEYLEKRKFERWKTDVSDKLDEISRKLDLILIELRNLRVYIDERVTEEVRRMFRTEIEGHRRAVEDMLAATGGGPLPPQMRERLRIAHLESLKIRTEQLASHATYGFAAYEAVLTGVLTVLLIHILVDDDSREAKVYARRMARTYLKDLSDPSMSGSLGHAHEILGREVVSKVDRYDGVTGRWLLTNLTEIHQDRDPPGANVAPDKSFVERYLWREQRIHGTWGMPYVIEHRKEESSSGPRSPWYPGLKKYSYADKDKSQRAVRLDLKERAAQVVDAMEREAKVKKRLDEVLGLIVRLERFATG